MTTSIYTKARLMPNLGLGAERAANEWTDHTDLLLWKLERLRQTLACDMHGLSGVVRG